MWLALSYLAYVNADLKYADIYLNADHSQGTTIELNPNHSLEDIFRQVFTKAPAVRSKAGKNPSLYNSAGLLLNATGIFNSITSGERLYIVPEKRHFMWPFVQVGHRVKLPDLDPVEIESVADSPRVFLLHNFLSSEEADGLITSALHIPAGPNALSRSTTGLELRENRDLNDEQSYSSSRTSSNAWDMTSDLAVKVKKRSFQMLRLAWKNSMADGLQTLRYEPGQAYNCHTDFFSPDPHHQHNFNPARGGTNRMATVFLYLSDVPAGGHTLFPRANKLDASALARLSPEAQSQLTSNFTPDIKREAEALFKNKKGGFEMRLLEQCYSQLAVQPRKGTAVLFYSQTSDLALDDASFHCACPVVEGLKWAANMWVWNGPRYGGTEDNDERSVSFTNNMGKHGSLFWDNQGKLYPQGDIRAGGTLTINTHSGHRFVFKVDDSPVYSIRIKEKTSKVNIRDRTKPKTEL